jgi:hypothetical protein
MSSTLLPEARHEKALFTYAQIRMQIGVRFQVTKDQPVNLHGLF